MMRITLPEAFFFYSTLSLAFIFILWFLFYSKRRRLERRRIFICRFCKEKIELEPGQITLRCPRCNAIQNVELRV
ncbi:Zn-finger containing protein [Methylacidiphilum infernorum V4]|uniref:Zn-finger containing protein n=1 Tax=Methylacidiphilum infernorum (isolate V4) TaxID=481448 RepID=B3DXS2_METI4|nr:Zn-finger containing protein [Methylacidiphilum infernorum V4]